MQLCGEIHHADLLSSSTSIHCIHVIGFSTGNKCRISAFSASQRTTFLVSPTPKARTMQQKTTSTCQPAMLILDKIKQILIRNLPPPTKEKIKKSTYFFHRASTPKRWFPCPCSHWEPNSTLAGSSQADAAATTVTSFRVSGIHKVILRKTNKHCIGVFWSITQEARYSACEKDPHVHPPP